MKNNNIHLHSGGVYVHAEEYSAMGNKCDFCMESKKSLIHTTESDTCICYDCLNKMFGENVFSSLSSLIFSSNDPEAKIVIHIKDLQDDDVYRDTSVGLVAEHISERCDYCGGMHDIFYFEKRSVNVCYACLNALFSEYVFEVVGALINMVRRDD